MEEEHESLLKTSSVIRYRSYWEHRVWIGDPKLLQELWQAERDGLVEKPEFPPFHRVRIVLKDYASRRRFRQHCSPALPVLTSCTLMNGTPSSAGAGYVIEAWHGSTTTQDCLKSSGAVCLRSPCNSWKYEHIIMQHIFVSACDSSLWSRVDCVRTLLAQQLWCCSPVLGTLRAQGAESDAGAGTECVLREDQSPHVAHRPKVRGTGLPGQQHEVRLPLQDWARQGRERASNALAVQAVSCQLCVRRLLVGWPSPWLAQAVPHVHVHMESRLRDNLQAGSEV